MYRDILFALAKINSLHLPNAAKALLRIANTDVRSPAERHVAMSWAQRLKRVFNVFVWDHGGKGICLRRAVQV